jgi:hypothetical protein
MAGEADEELGGDGCGIGRVVEGGGVTTLKRRDEEE